MHTDHRKLWFDLNLSKFVVGHVNIVWSIVFFQPADSLPWTLS